MKMLFKVCGAIFVLLFLNAGSATADPLWDDSAWLSAMAFAAHQTNFSGVFVYQSGSRVEMSRITHLADKDGEHERLEGLDGLKREVIRNNDTVWLFLGGKKVRVEKRRAQHSFPALLPEQIQTLKENYQIVQAGEDRVAEYHAHTVVFRPKDNLRYTRKMWADSATGLLLKAEILDERGGVIEQYAFSQLTIGGNFDRKWIIPKDVEITNSPAQNNIVSPAQANLDKVPSGWQIDFVPTGFKRILEMKRTISDKKLPVVHIVYSDGLAGISVFIEKVGVGAEAKIGLSSQGAVHIYSRLLGDSLVTVVGEITPRAVIQVADSVRYAGE